MGVGPVGVGPVGVGPVGDALGPLAVAIVAVEVGQRTRVVLELRVGASGGETLELSLRGFGAYNARNAAAAVAVAARLGLDRRAVVEALEAVDPVGDRGRVHRLGEHLLIADCYNANPGSMAAALDSLASLAVAGPRIAVLGDMLELGPRERELHAELGVHAGARGLDGVVGIGPRCAELVAAAAEAGVATLHLADPAPTSSVAAAVAWVRARLEAGHGGAVLVKASRGLRLERVVEALATGERSSPEGPGGPHGGPHDAR